MAGFLSELLSVFGKRKHEPSKYSSKPDSSPAKRQRQDQMPDDHVGVAAVNGNHTERPKEQMLEPVRQQQHQLKQQQQQQQQQPRMQQHKPTVQQTQQARQSMLQPSRHLADSSARQRPVNNTFRQLQADAWRASNSPAYAGGSQPRHRYFAGSVPSMRPAVGPSSTPLLGYAAAGTPHAALRSAPRMPAASGFSQQQWQRRQGAAAAAAGFGLPVTPAAAASPDPIKQRLSFELQEAATAAAAAARAAARTAPAAWTPTAAAKAGAGAAPSHDGLAAAAAAAAAGHVPAANGLFMQAMRQEAGPVGVALHDPAGYGGSSSSRQAWAAGMLFAGVPALRDAAVDEAAKLEQEVAAQQRELQLLQQRDKKFFAKDVQQLQSSSRKALLALSPEYQANPASRPQLQEMAQVAARKQQQRLQHEQELLQRRTAASPAAARAAAAAEAAAPAALQQQLQRQATARLAAAGAAAQQPVTGLSQQQQQQQQQQQEEESDDVICLSSGDEDEEQQQQQQQQQQQHGENQADESSEEEGSSYEDEEEEEEEEGSAEEVEGAVSAAAAGVGRLRLDRWLGQRSKWTPTQQQLQRFEVAVGPGPADELLTSHQRANIDLRREHMLCLRVKEWLNDEVMNMYVAMLQDRDTAMRHLAGQSYPRCHFFNTFFLNKLYKDAQRYNYQNVRRWTLPKRLELAGQASSSVLDVDRIIVPVHEGLHWTAIMADVANKRIVHFDSLGGRNPWAIDSIKIWLADEAKDKRQESWDTASWDVLCPQDIPRQTNGCDCGVFSLLFCNRLGLGQPFDFAQADLLINARVRIACELLDGRLPLPGKGS